MGTYFLITISNTIQNIRQRLVDVSYSVNFCAKSLWKYCLFHLISHSQPRAAVEFQSQNCWSSGVVWDIVKWRILGNLRAENSIFFLWFYVNLDHRIRSLTQLLEAILLDLRLLLYTISKWCLQLSCTSQSTHSFVFWKRFFYALQFT